MTTLNGPAVSRKITLGHVRIMLIKDPCTEEAIGDTLPELKGDPDQQGNLSNGRFRDRPFWDRYLEQLPHVHPPRFLRNHICMDLETCQGT